jgi:hypothetical protein
MDQEPVMALMREDGLISVSPNWRGCLLHLSKKKYLVPVLKSVAFGLAGVYLGMVIDTAIHIPKFGPFMGLAIGLPVLIACVIRNVRNTWYYNRVFWRAKVQEWNSLFVCKACGFIFKPEPIIQSVAPTYSTMNSRWSPEADHSMHDDLFPHLKTPV